MTAQGAHLPAGHDAARRHRLFSSAFSTPFRSRGLPLLHSLVFTLLLVAHQFCLGFGTWHHQSSVLLRPSFHLAWFMPTRTLSYLATAQGNQDDLHELGSLFLVAQREQQAEC